MKNSFILFFCILGCMASVCAEPPPEQALSPFEKLLNQAKAAHPDRYAFALQHKAQIFPTPDGQSFYVLWVPKPNSPIIVTLHGHASWALDEFFLWQRFAEKHGYGILAIQWWFGQGEEISDYYTPEGIYPMIQSTLRELGVTPGRAVLHGFSRGAANTYAIASLDVRSNTHLFGACIANAGGASPDYPLYRDITFGKFGFKAFEQTHWILYCGGRDDHPERDGCEAMHNTQEWLERFGGKVDLFMEDPDGDHGGFHRNPKNIEAALEVCDRLVKPAPRKSQIP